MWILKVLQQWSKKTMGNNPRRIAKIEIDIVFPKGYDSKTKNYFRKGCL